VVQRRAATAVDCLQSSKRKRLLDARALQHPAVHQHQRVMQLQPLIAVVAKPLLFPKLQLHAATVEPLLIREAFPRHRLFLQHLLLPLPLLLQQFQPHQRFLLPLQHQKLLFRRAMFLRRNAANTEAICSQPDTDWFWLGYD